VGRDLLSRIIYGARITLLVGLLSVALGVIIGVSLGLITGYCGGKVDLIAQGAVDCVMAFPAIVLALALVAVLGTSLSNVIVAIAIVISPRVARVVRGSVLSVKEEEYIMASKASGCSHSRILFLHILPNVMASIIVMATINLGQAILVEAALSFLGLGVPPPASSWGRMLSGAGKQYMIQAPWLAFFPGFAISVVVLSFNLLGDALRDVLDPRMKR
jgi:ABC-type dipeptide/oligopeptide/nickel transport system permease subunit